MGRRRRAGKKVQGERLRRLEKEKSALSPRLTHDPAGTRATTLNASHKSVFDAEMAAAVAGIRFRAENEETREYALADGSHIDGALRSTFVDTGLLLPIKNDNDQVIFGRRGTGKTHIMRYLDTEWRNAGRCVCYVDCRRLGSSAQFTELSLPLRDRCTALFRDIFFDIFSAIQFAVLRNPPDNSSWAILEQRLEALRASVADPYKVLTKQKRTTKSDKSRTRDEGAAAAGGIDKLPQAKVSSRTSSSTKKSIELEDELHIEDSILFPDVVEGLADILERSQLRLYVLLDEWSSLPRDLQPYLAEFLRRTLVPLNRAVLKIAALEQRTTLATDTSVGRIGLEVGGDLTIARNLDDYYGYEIQSQQQAETLALILFRHLDAALGPKLKNYGIHTHSNIVGAFFHGDPRATSTQSPAFNELVAASAGIVRDFLQLFSYSFASDASRANRTIATKSVRASAVNLTTTWKVLRLPSRFAEAVELLVKFAVKTERRFLLLDQSTEQRHVVQELLDARLIHVVGRSVVDLSKPGKFFLKFALDAGLVIPYIEEGLPISLFDGHRIPYDALSATLAKSLAAL